MPVTKVKSRWVGGDLIFYDASTLASGGYVLRIAEDEIEIYQDVTITGDVALTGDLTIDTEDLALGDDDDLEFGDGTDVLTRWSTADASNHTFVVALDDTGQQMHITDKGAVATDWARSAGTHPEVAIHSNTTPITDYLAIGNHDGTTAHIDVVGGTTLSLDIAGTAEVVIAAASTSPATTDSNALGTAALMWSDLFLASGAVVNFDNGDVTLTHSADTLTLGGATNLAVTTGDLTFGGSIDSASIADEVSFGGYDIGAGNRVMAISQETAVAAEADETKFSNKVQCRINGATYFIMLTAT